MIGSHECSPAQAQEPAIVNDLRLTPNGLPDECRQRLEHERNADAVRGDVVLFDDTDTKCGHTHKEKNRCC
ncbi:MAG: hypothetical protein MUF54_12415 [Polyangiaceae bacterium]|nr:hypothetical protein [Polyangiaceae bacterium]